ncbi:hypothetical protein ACFW9L_40055 [Streptomyces sp. NPDC059517]
MIDERPAEGLWPCGVLHDDALFCETGVAGSCDATDDAVTP